MTLRLFINALLFLILCATTSCDKGYEVRFTNYYTEPMDSVVIGKDYIIYTNVDLQATTDYKKLMAGKHSVLMITKSKHRISSDFTIPSKGSGKRTFQVDAIEQTVLLED